MEVVIPRAINESFKRVQACTVHILSGFADWCRTHAPLSPQGTDVDEFEVAVALAEIADALPELYGIEFDLAVKLLLEQEEDALIKILDPTSAFDGATIDNNFGDWIFTVQAKVHELENEFQEDGHPLCKQIDQAAAGESNPLDCSPAAARKAWHLVRKQHREDTRRKW